MIETAKFGCVEGSYIAGIVGGEGPLGMVKNYIEKNATKLSEKYGLEKPKI